MDLPSLTALACITEYLFVVDCALKSQFITLTEEQKDLCNKAVNWKAEHGSDQELCLAVGEKLLQETGEMNQVERYNFYLSKLQITEPYYKVCYTIQDTLPATKFVLIWAIDEDTDSCRNINGEMFFGNGSSTTREEFIKEYETLYSDCGVRLVDCSEVHERPEQYLIKTCEGLLTIEK